LPGCRRHRRRRVQGRWNRPNRGPGRGPKSVRNEYEDSNHFYRKRTDEQD
jgi:hypothetical protein